MKVVMKVKLEVFYNPCKISRLNFYFHSFSRERSELDLRNHWVVDNDCFNSVQMPLLLISPSCD